MSALSFDMDDVKTNLDKTEAEIHNQADKFFKNNDGNMDLDIQ